MPSLIQIRNTPLSMLCGACVLLSCLFLMACGGGHEASTTGATPKFPPKSVGACLARGGAVLAESADQLAFLSEAEANDSVSMPGLTYDRAAHVPVKVWTSAVDRADGPEWLMWIAEQLDQKQTPVEIAKSPPHTTSYVMFVNHPAPNVRRKVESCIDFSGNAHKVNYHSITGQ